jgi:lipopolysaccharide biosynthesis glycosyltransferase
MRLDFLAPAETDAAVVLACDAGYLPYALHLAWQIVLAHPERDFDILIASEAPLTLPDWAREAGIGNPVPADFGRAGDLKVGHLTRCTYLRLFLPDMLAGRYKRLLYLDTDIFLEAGGLDRLLRVPLGNHILAATKDVTTLLHPGHHAADYRAIGEPVRGYFNTGVMVIDNAAWGAAQILERCLKLAVDRPEVLVKHDESLLNGVMLGNFAELSPVWNWMCNQRFPFATRHCPVRLRHFIGGNKPWRDPKGRHDARFGAAYAAFFRRGLAGADGGKMLQKTDSKMMSFGRTARHLVDHLLYRKRLEAELSRFRDDFDVKLPGGPQAVVQ